MVTSWPLPSCPPRSWLGHDVTVLPVLTVIGGLPATGKSTIATLLASQTRAPYVRVDRIEQAIVDWSALAHPLGPVGYGVAYAVAGEQLSLGLDVVVECVNPVELTRESWRSTAERAGAAVVEVELVCSDLAEHRRRVESRRSDIDRLVLPTWEQVVRREYHAWDQPHLVIDTSETPPLEAVERISVEIAAAHDRGHDD